MNFREWKAASPRERLWAVRNGVDRFVTYTDEDVADWTYGRYVREIAEDKYKTARIRLKGTLEYMKLRMRP